MTSRRALAAAVAAAAVAAGALPAPALAAQVRNPGAVRFSVTGGSLKLAGQTVSLAGKRFAFAGTVTRAGRIRLPGARAALPPFGLTGSFSAYKVALHAGDATGALRPGTGALSVTLPIWVTLSGPAIPAGCAAGSATDPIVLRLAGGGRPATSTLPPSGTRLARVTVSDRRFTVPSVAGCGGPMTGVINGALGLPSAPGSSSITLAMKLATPLRLG